MVLHEVADLIHRNHPFLLCSNEDCRLELPTLSEYIITERTCRGGQASTIAVGRIGRRTIINDVYGANHPNTHPNKNP